MDNKAIIDNNKVVLEDVVTCTKDTITYTQDDKNSYSMARLMSITSLWTSIVFAIATVTLACFGLTTGAQYALGIAVIHIVAAYAGKSVSKLLENDNFFLYKIKKE